MFKEVPVAVKHTKNDILNTNVKYGVWYDMLTEYKDMLKIRKVIHRQIYYLSVINLIYVYNGQLKMNDKEGIINFNMKIKCYYL